MDDYNSYKYLDGKFVYEGFAYAQEKSSEEEEEGQGGEEEKKESEGGGGERNVASTSLHAKTWTLRSTALPLELLDSEHDEPLQGRFYKDFPHSEGKKKKKKREEGARGKTEGSRRWREVGLKRGTRKEKETLDGMERGDTRDRY